MTTSVTCDAAGFGGHSPSPGPPVGFQSDAPRRSTASLPPSCQHTYGELGMEQDMQNFLSENYHSNPIISIKDLSKKKFTRGQMLRKEYMAMLVVILFVIKGSIQCAFTQ